MPQAVAIAQQEAEIVAEPKLFLAAICVLNLLDFDDMLSLYQFEPAELLNGRLSRASTVAFVELALMSGCGGISRVDPSRTT